MLYKRYLWPRTHEPKHPSTVLGHLDTLRRPAQEKSVLESQDSKTQFFWLFFQKFLDELLNLVSVSETLDFRHDRAHEFSHVLHAAFNT